MTPLLTINDVAPLLGKTTRGVRKLIDRSRRAATGEAVNGATIRFCQDGKWGAILFRPEWVEEYIRHITVSSTAENAKQRAARKNGARPLTWSDL